VLVVGILKKSKKELSRIAKKAVVTRKKNVQHLKSQKAGKKAWKESIRPSEYGLIAKLSKTLGINKKCIFHHEGFPDIMVVAADGRMQFYEVKPKKGGRTRKMLSPSQVKTIRELLKHDYVEEVNLVRYEKKGKQIAYDEPIKLTRSNLKQYSL
jgi:hypothetical protein